MDLKNIVTDDERRKLNEIYPLLSAIKNKYFNLGRDIDKFFKLCDSIIGKEKK